MKKMIYLKMKFQLIQLKVNRTFFLSKIKTELFVLEAPKGEKRKRIANNQEENGVEDDDGPPRKI